jgi:trimethylamine--corrinoid protein Co-methyltransferase
MPENLFTRAPLAILPTEAVERLHVETIRLLETTGVRVDHDEALELLCAYGVRCDLDRRRAYPDAGAVNRALASVRKAYTLHGRDPERPTALPVDGHHTYAICGGAALRMYADGRYTAVTEDDLVAMTALHERLEHVDVLINVVEPPPAGRSLYTRLAATLFCHASKPLLLQAGGREDLRAIIRMATLIAGGEHALRDRPLFMTGGNAEPPLRIPREGAEVLIEAARAGIPVSIGDYMMLGSTGPAHLLAALVQRAATVLTGLVLTQAAAPGSIYDFSCHSGLCDLRNADAITMSGTVMRLAATAVQMGRRYGLVTHSLACTEARAPDAQAAGERAAALIAAFASGATFIHHSTSCMAGMELADPAQSVLDNALIGQAKAFAAATPEDGLEEALAAVREVATDPQYDGLYFLGHAHTAAQGARGADDAGLFETGQLARWLNGARTPLYERAAARARTLTAEPREFVSPELKRELFRLAGEAG